MVLLLVAGVILAVIVALFTKSIIIGILFPILLVIFFLMWRSIKKESLKQLESKKETSEIQTNETETPPVSTSYPPRQE